MQALALGGDCADRRERGKEEGLEGGSESVEEELGCGAVGGVIADVLLEEEMWGQERRGC